MQKDMKSTAQEKSHNEAQRWEIIVRSPRHGVYLWDLVPTEDQKINGTDNEITESQGLIDLMSRI